MITVLLILPHAVSSISRNCHCYISTETAIVKILYSKSVIAVSMKIKNVNNIRLLKTVEK